MTKIDLHEAEAHFAQYVARVKSGETIVLCDQNIPVAEIRPVPQEALRKERPYGLYKGQIQILEDWSKADEEIAQLFEESEIFPKHRISEDENPH